MDQNQDNTLPTLDVQDAEHEVDTGTSEAMDAADSDNSVQILPVRMNIAAALAEMMTMQHKANLVMGGEDYITKGLDYDAAILAEVGELLDSNAYKWWKNTPIDIENIKVEIVDIWHFLMAKFITQAVHKNDDVPGFIQYFANYSQTIFASINYTDQELATILENNNDDKKALQFFSKQLVRRTLQQESHNVITLSLVEMCASVRMSFSEFYKRYIVKNSLNIIRQNYGENGSNNLTYNRQWPIDAGSEVTGEDNHVALSLVMNAGEVNFDKAYELLENYYRDSVIKIPRA